MAAAKTASGSSRRLPCRWSTAIPRFFFHTRNGKSITDHKGVDLPDWDVARLNAISVAGRILADEPQRIAVGEDWTMEVTDESGLVLFKIDFHVTASPPVRSDRLPKERAD